MSGEKKRHRWRPGPIFVEENITVDSKLRKTTQTSTTEEEKHTENKIRKWYNNNIDEDDDNRTSSEIPLRTLSPNETISERIERVLRRINAWTNETSSTPTNNIQRESLHDTSFNKTNLSAYDNIRQRQRYKSRFIKPPTNSLFNSFRQRCCSSTSAEPNVNQNQQHRPHSMVFIDESFPSITTTSCILPNDNPNNLYEDEDRKVREDKFIIYKMNMIDMNKYYPFKSERSFLSSANQIIDYLSVT